MHTYYTYMVSIRPILFSEITIPNTILVLGEIHVTNGLNLLRLLVTVNNRFSLN